jgi:hypothetical protein
MDRSRRIFVSILSLLAALALLSIARGLDRFCSAFANNVGCIGATPSCRFWRLAATALFVLLALLYLRFVAWTPRKAVAMRLASLAIGLIVIVYPYVQSHIPFLNYYELRPMPFLLSIHRALMSSDPRSFLILSALLIATAALFSLASGGVKEG